MASVREGGKLEPPLSIQSKVVLGTASWGNQYGLFNSTSVGAETAKNILKIASSGGVNTLDTAPAYGDSEAVLGGCDLTKLSLYTKVDPESWDRGSDYAYIQLRESLRTLGIESLRGLTFHSAESFLGDPKRAMDFVSRIRAEGLAMNWGVSVYDPSQALEVMRFTPPDYIQAPVSLMDRRFLASSFLEKIDAMGVGLQARSLFLQGLLLRAPNQIPSQFKPWVELFSGYSSSAWKQGLSRFQYALMPVLQHPAIQTAVIGVNEESHIQELAAALSGGEIALTLDEIESSEDLNLIDPRKWRK